MIGAGQRPVSIYFCMQQQEQSVNVNFGCGDANTSIVACQHSIAAEHSNLIMMHEPAVRRHRRRRDQNRCGGLGACLAQTGSSALSRADRMATRIQLRLFPGFLVLALLALPAQGKTTTSTMAVASTPTPVQNTFACKNCVDRPVRAMYLYTADATECLNAPGNGSLCDDIRTATPECFNWENWKGGWVGATVHRIFSEVNPPSVVAMTRANFSAEVYAKYKGGSSFTRCVYEIRLDNVDICVGNFWETAERRKLVPFSSQMFADTMRLVTVPRGFKATNR